MRALNMQALTNAVKRRHPGVTVYGVGDDRHRLRTSDHNEDDTPGSLAEQSDSDNVPEHRAIDIMLGAAFTRAQADELIRGLVADPAATARLRYIIFNGSIWSRNYGWVRRDFGGDPHTDHIHISGLSADDENAAGWPAVEGDDMTPAELLGTRLGKSTVTVAQALQETERNVRELAGRPPVQAAPVDPATVKAALLDPEFLAALAKAVNDDAAARLQS